jgi:hypothetical protein
MMDFIRMTMQMDGMVMWYFMYVIYIYFLLGYIFGFGEAEFRSLAY